MGTKKTTEQFREEVNTLGNGDYILCSPYTGARKKITIKHLKCGNKYQVIAYSFLAGTRCPYCNKYRKKTPESFLQQAKQLVGDEYTFLSKYTGVKNRIKVRHNKCGYEYKVIPDDFLRGSRCPRCFGHNPYNDKEFQEKVNKIHNNEYQILSHYINNHTKVKVKHLVCGNVYEVTPNSILNGRRCPKCYGTPKKTTKQFKQEVFNLVGNEYTVIGQYKGTNTKIEMKHNKCGHIWKIEPSKFLHNRRCPYCNESHGEQAIKKSLRELKIHYVSQKRFDNCRYKKPLPFDFYLPELRVAIEFDGSQHFVPYKHFGGNKKLELYKKRDSIKNQYCIEKHIKLIRINYTIGLDNITEFLREVI